MIVGLFLKNIKCYKDVNFIPLTTESPFCGLIGKNGAGKSAVLEALDWVMNDKKNWNLHISCKKNGARSTPHIVPVFCIPKDNVKENIELFEKASNAFWTIEQKDATSLTENSWKLFVKFRDSLKRVQKEKFIVPIGLYINTEKNIVPSSGLFDFATKADLEKILDNCREMYDYIYIPKDIEPDKMMLLQTDELQTAIGKTLEDVVAEIFDSEKIKEISKKLKSFTDDISKKLGVYLFREPLKIHSFPEDWFICRFQA